MFDDFHFWLSLVFFLPKQTQDLALSWARREKTAGLRYYKVKGMDPTAWIGRS